MTVPIFELPDELRLSLITKQFPCREPQIRALATLLNPSSAPCRNLVVYGTEATGKSAITTALLASLDGDSFKHAIVNSIECITARHLYETVVGKVAAAVEWEAVAPRCESVSQLTVELSKMLRYTERPDGFRFVLVFDGIDHQREAPHTLLPALAKLSEIIPSLTTLFILTSPPPNNLLTTFTPNLHFPTYTKPEFITILSLSPPPPITPSTTPTETLDLYTRFLSALHDSLSRPASRTLPSLTQASRTLWPKFIQPILARTHTVKEFSKLIVLARVHFQDESLLDPTLSLSPPPTTTTTTPNPTIKTTDLATLLPTTARFLLLSAYLASHNPTKSDLTLFSTFHHGRKRRRGGFTGGRARKNGSQHRKIARKLLGAHAFVLERMLAIFMAVRTEWDPASGGRTKNGIVEGEQGLDNDIYMSIATLASLRLLVKVGGGGDVTDLGGKWRVAVGWEVVRGLGRSVGVEVEEWLVE